MSSMTRASSKNEHIRIGVISDTHGLLRPEAEAALQGVSLIIHAGDIGSPLILEQLNNIASVVAVRGNMDSDGWAQNLHRTEIIEQNDNLIYVIHDSSRIDLDTVAAKISVVICGHSHRPSISRNKNILYINPGSAGPQRFSLPVSVAILNINDKSVDAEIIALEI